MSGHNKWSQIKRKKEATDAKKSQVFSRLVKEISVQAKLAGGNTSSPGLATAIRKAREANMPADNIERAIKKGTDSKENMEHIIYEGYAPGGIGVVIEALTSNRNKASQEIRHVFTKYGGALGAQGSVTWGFEKSEQGWLPTMTVPADDETLEILSKIVDELEESEEVQEVFTNAE